MSKQAMMSKVSGIVLLAGMVGLSTTANAGDAAAGKAKATAYACGSCHGAAGIATTPTFPNLAGQKEMYLVSAMTAYKNGQRQGGMSGVMTAQAAKLSKDDIDNIAAYYASLK